jgi:hypothetical protein
MSADAPCRPPTVHGDPSGFSRHAYSEERYEHFDPAFGSLVGSACYPAHVSDPVDPKTTVWVPDAPFAAIGPAPIVFLVHGANPSPLSYLGYGYLQGALARLGIIAVSVRLRPDVNDEASAPLVVAHVRHFAKRNGTIGDRFFAKVDVKNVGLFGHSRAGITVMAVPELLDGTFRVGALLALASDQRKGGPPPGIPFMTILPAAEGGITVFVPPYGNEPGFPDVPGAQNYDRDLPAPFKAQLYVHHADHELWNQNWKTKDANPSKSDVFPRENHEMILRAYGTAFFRAFLQDLPSSPGEQGNFLKQPEGAISYLNGFRLPALARAPSPSSGQYGSFKVDPHDLVPAWQSAFALTVDDNRHGVQRNALGGATSVKNLHVAQMEGQGTGDYAGDARLMIARVLACSGPDCPGFIRTELPEPARDLRERTAVLVRAGETLPPTFPPEGVSFDLGLESASGEVAWVPAEHVGGVPRPYHRSDSAARFVLKTLRFSLACFKGASGDFIDRHRGDIRAIRLRPRAAVGREIAFDHLQLE